MTEMWAIAIREPGGPEVLVPEQIARPRPGSAQVLIGGSGWCQPS